MKSRVTFRFFVMFEKIVCQDVGRKGAAEISYLRIPPARLIKETGRLSRALWQLMEREVIDVGV
jgi:hypothetical protein